MRSVFCTLLLFVACCGTLSAQESTDRLRTSSDKSQSVFDGGFRNERHDPQQQGDTIFDVAEVDQPPQFPGGPEALFTYMSKSLQHPDSATVRTTASRVAVEFVVDKEGNVGRVRVLKGVEPVADKAAMRLVSTMPKWTPGTIDGRPVAARMILPMRVEPTKAR